MRKVVVPRHGAWALLVTVLGHQVYKKNIELKDKGENENTKNSGVVKDRFLEVYE